MSGVSIPKFANLKYERDYVRNMQIQTNEINLEVDKCDNTVNNSRPKSQQIGLGIIRAFHRAQN